MILTESELLTLDEAEKTAVQCTAANMDDPARARTDRDKVDRLIRVVQLLLAIFRGQAERAARDGGESANALCGRG